MSTEERARVFKALSDPRRIELLDALADHGPQCGTELADRLGISVALLSHHWEVLCDAGLIAKSRVGQLRYCSLVASDKLSAATEGWEDLAAEQPEAPAKPKAKKTKKRSAAAAEKAKPARRVARPSR